MEIKKFLSKENLTFLWGKLKSWIESKFSSFESKHFANSNVKVNVTVPADAVFTDTNTEYSAGKGIHLKGTQIINTGVNSISAGSSPGTLNVIRSDNAGQSYSVPVTVPRGDGMDIKWDKQSNSQVYIKFYSSTGTLNLLMYYGYCPASYFTSNYKDYVLPAALPSGYVYWQVLTSYGREARIEQDIGHCHAVLKDRSTLRIYSEDGTRSNVYFMLLVQYV